MIRPALVALIATASCGRAQGVADEDLGGLVKETRTEASPIQPARAAKDPAELARALMRPHHEIAAALGLHRATIASKTTVVEAGQVVTDLGDQTTIELGDGGTYHAVYENTADYGREVTFVGDTLYLRPRYQRWHARAPQTADEPVALRDSFFAPIAATWDLLGPAVELTDQGTVDVGGRAGRKIAVKRSPRPVTPPPEPLAQRAWRERRAIDEVSGEVILDADTGAPLRVSLAGTVGFSRDGRRFQMKTQLTAELAGFATAATISAPPEAEVVATPERLREVDERDYLLKGIAPPIRKNADGTAATPDLPATREPATPRATP